MYPNLIVKGEFELIQITKAESQYLRKIAPHIHQVVLNPHAPARKKSYLVPEELPTMRLLVKYRIARGAQ